MKVLVVGGGGREHALAWKLCQSAHVSQVFVAPGNAGTAAEPKAKNVEIGAEDIPALLDFAKRQGIDLTLVGPEAPLVDGIVDQFEAEHLPIFGPVAATARLEGSKSFAKQFMQRHRIPTADYAVFTDFAEAHDYIVSRPAPMVVKADGLAAGKGVIIAQDHADALDSARQMLSGERFGDAGKSIVVEEFIQGEEASFICMADGEHVLSMATSQDHKKRDIGDAGPNTGGMGAYSPAPIVNETLHQRILDKVIYPTVRGFAEQGTPYLGFLYAGLMIDAQGDPHVLEFNCRFGDPEAQPILMRMQSDLAELCLAALAKQLDQHVIQWDARTALGVVLAAGGYPSDTYEKGAVIQGLSESRETPVQKVFHAGTCERDGRVLTSGGRVLCATALGDTVGQAQQRAYSLAKQISWPQMFYRPDIGHRAVDDNR